MEKKKQSLFFFYNHPPKSRKANKMQKERLVVKNEFFFFPVFSWFFSFFTVFLVPIWHQISFLLILISTKATRTAPQEEGKIFFVQIFPWKDTAAVNQRPCGRFFFFRPLKYPGFGQKWTPYFLHLQKIKTFILLPKISRLQGAVEVTHRPCGRFFFPP